MTKKLFLSCFFVFLFMPAVVFAGPLEQGNGYVGIQYGYLMYDMDSISGDSNPSALIGRVGYFVFDQVALEGRFGFGFSDDSARLPDDAGGTIRGDLELDRLYGAYLAGYLPLGGFGSAYGVLGYTDAKATFSADGFSSSISDGGFSFGFGGNVYIEYRESAYKEHRWAINVEYMRYLNESGYKLDAYGFGVAFQF